ncbi:MAG: hypothetical protein H6822_35280 [Planctomycetaceae bacterium]|nr:hypothetical protein [Planctomycetales bacterium]MCB9927450.1 hypothetical protein [Planctomycetaceae bacterium]
MGNGRPYDHPLTDIINHRILTFSETADDLIRQIALLIPPQKIDEYVNWQSPPPIAEFEAELRTILTQLRDNATEPTDEREPE